LGAQHHERWQPRALIKQPSCAPDRRWEFCGAESLCFWRDKKFLCETMLNFKVVSSSVHEHVIIDRSHVLREAAYVSMAWICHGHKARPLPRVLAELQLFAEP
jgi:hypothetical protein